ncbi:MAG: hypothetical protein LAT62_09080 [Natronospirillum sp.]|uniref:hypothetical protein n=1 Tax=Natronospirillum sp. TaxID=2812955 RepID=UPI0025FAC969|nr:hypothetical protein [Natronospirillum sp.]MCH8552076.1 hypothetical protein [Natronospirillum sp.]
MQTLRRYLDTIEAELALGRLQAEGLSARLDHGGLQNISHAMVEVLLQVDPDDMTQAEHILSAMEDGSLTLDEGCDVGDPENGDTSSR